MDAKDKIYYCVVQFLQKPHPHIGQYVIVPDSWIKSRGDRICVLYPDVGQVANLNTIYTMDPNNKGDKIKWSQYLSELKHTAENYEDATEYIKKKSYVQNNKPNSSKIEATTPISIKNQKRCHDKLAHCSSDSKVKKQRQDINPVEEISKDICKEFIPPFILRSLFKQQFEDQFLHTKATEPTNKQAPCKGRRSDSSEVYDGTVRPTKRNVATFVLPPEYDERDSRWTLRYRELGPGLAKLVPEYDVYVDKKQLNDILNFSTSAIELVRLLLIKIFSDNALRTCSLTAMRVYGRPTEIRPGLDASGRYALLKFLRLWEQKKEWDPMDEKDVDATLRSKLREWRRLKIKTPSNIQ